jgi:hypothetical protein
VAALRPTGFWNSRTGTPAPAPGSLRRSEFSWRVPVQRIPEANRRSAFLYFSQHFQANKGTQRKRYYHIRK